MNCETVSGCVVVLFELSTHNQTDDVGRMKATTVAMQVMWYTVQCRMDSSEVCIDKTSAGSMTATPSPTGQHMLVFRAKGRKKCRYFHCY